MNILEMKNITKKFGNVKALDNVSLNLRSGDCCGLCGENGSGKSTMMKVLSAVYPHGDWEGEITFNGKVLQAKNISETEHEGIVIIHQELMLVPQMSVAENIYLGREPLTKLGTIDYNKMNQDSANFLQELGMSDINVTDAVMNYGSGHRQLIEIAKALSKKAKLIIFDEPSSSLSESEIKYLLKIIKDLKKQGIACIYISHKLEEVNEIADTICVIRDGKHIGTKLISEVNVDEIIKMMVGREMKSLFPKSNHKTGDIIFEVKGLTCYDVTNPSLKVVDNVSFNVKQGEILGVSGLVGAGRTETVQAIFGSYKGAYRGKFFLHGKEITIKQPRDSIKYKISQVPEDRKLQGIVPILSVGDNITKATLSKYKNKFGFINEAQENTAIIKAIDALHVKTSSPELAIGGLSGGNQQKAVIAKMLETQPNVLILDEPTRGIDIKAKSEIYKLIVEITKKQNTSVIMVSSELPEILGLSDRVLVFGKGQIKAEFINDENLTQEKIMSAAIS